jgi:mycofactocin system glycosyltransferase
VTVDADRALVGFRIALSPDAQLWAGSAVVTGGAPWRVARLGSTARPFMSSVARAGEAGALVETAHDARVAREMLDRGFVHPVVTPAVAHHEVTVVVPAFDRADSLSRCLASLRGFDVVVVDDGSRDAAAVAAVVARHRARLVCHSENRGPAAARNTGICHSPMPYLAFVDSDCVVQPGWLDMLMPHFADPAVVAVAPRIRADDRADSWVARHDRTRSSLDMGTKPSLVRPGGRVGFVPTAALVVRGSALDEVRFDETLRLGEDVDFVWRLGDSGGLVRFEPRAEVVHESPHRVWPWARRRYEYGTSAAPLARRHPRRLAPARPSAPTLVVLLLLAARRPAAAIVAAVLSTLPVARRLEGSEHRVRIACVIVGKGVASDAAGIGHLMRREWWPVGVLAAACTPRSRFARAVTGVTVAPLVFEWAGSRRDVGLVRYLALRLIGDAAYGSGVLVGAWRHKLVAPLMPEVRGPWVGVLRQMARGVRWPAGLAPRPHR